MGSKFHERFGISVPITEARDQFVNRALVIVFRWDVVDRSFKDAVLRRVIIDLGAKPDPYLTKVEHYVDHDFTKTLQALESIYGLFISHRNETMARQLEARIDELFRLSPVDIGVRWSSGIFLPSGAPELDERLVNDTLKWLADSKYTTIRDPFEKALRHFLGSHKRPELLNDVVTDAYEALEALSKLVTASNKDLSANRELFLRRLGSVSGLGLVLKEYIAYGCRYRHAAKPDESRKTPTAADAEAFVYLTGVFIRLAVNNISLQ